ncbi:MAG: N-formylglutamate deformylase [Rhizobiaceae bacterium]
MKPFEVNHGNSPIVLGLPHTGTQVPDDIHSRLNDRGRTLSDTDWHVHRLYEGLLPDATTVRATFHRYVIDANRDPTGKSLYPGQNTTGLIPLTDFDNNPLWITGDEPTEADTTARLKAFHTPYHAALKAELDRVRAMHGIAILYDCHSIRSCCPFLFEGRLPDFNIGDNGGTTCAPEITGIVERVCAEAEGYTHVVNGRFKGGWTTRHYGRPAENMHAIQMELAQATHLQSETLPFDYAPDTAGQLRVHLSELLRQLENWALSK